MRDKDFVLSRFPNAVALKANSGFDRGWTVLGKNPDGSSVCGHGGIAGQAWAKAAKTIRYFDRAAARNAELEPRVRAGINEIAAFHDVDPSTARSIIAHAFNLTKVGDTTIYDIQRIVNEKG